MKYWRAAISTALSLAVTIMARGVICYNIKLGAAAWHAVCRSQYLCAAAAKSVVNLADKSIAAARMA